jgi:hydroxymethylpyrimidine pyrophosphatase-like HAD family hydrolase
VKAAGIGIAMGNAMDELKRAADYITDAIDQDGIKNACLHFGLIRQ